MSGSVLKILEVQFENEMKFIKWLKVVGYSFCMPWTEQKVCQLRWTFKHVHAALSCCQVLDHKFSHSRTMGSRVRSGELGSEETSPCCC